MMYCSAYEPSAGQGKAHKPNLLEACGQGLGSCAPVVLQLGSMGCSQGMLCFEPLSLNLDQCLTSAMCSCKGCRETLCTTFLPFTHALQNLSAQAFEL